MSLGTNQPLSPLTDEQLLERHRRGHPEAYTLLVKRYEKELFHFLIRFTNDGAAAEDVFQEAFLQVHLSADTFDTGRRFKPWLFTIAANKARDYLRRISRTHTVPLSAPVDAAGEDVRAFIDLMEADVPMPQDQLQSAETKALVRQVVALLPDHMREVLLLAYFHQFAYKQIAEILSIPLGTVKSRLHASVGTFAQLWKQHYQHAKYGEPSDG